MFKTLVIAVILSVAVADESVQPSGALAGNADQTKRLGIPGVAELDLSKGADGLGIGLETVADHGIRGHVGKDGATFNIGRTGHHTVEGNVGPNGATIGAEINGNQVVGAHIGLDGASASAGPLGAHIGLDGATASVGPLEAHIGLDGMSIGKGDAKLSLPNPFKLFG